MTISEAVPASHEKHGGAFKHDEADLPVKGADYNCGIEFTGLT